MVDWLNRPRHRIGKIREAFLKINIFLVLVILIDLVFSDLDPGTGLERFGPSETSEITVPTWKIRIKNPKWNASKLFQPIYKRIQ